MKNVTVISYPGTDEASLLSLTEKRSRYMLPFGGRFRVLDFTLRNSFSAGVKSTIIYSKNEDGLEAYVDKYGPFTGPDSPSIEVVSHNYSDLKVSKKLIQENKSKYFILYNGDIPSIIDFNEIIKKYLKSKSKAMLFKININGKASLAYKVLVSDQKTLLGIIQKATKEQRTSPNIFEMVINMMLNKGIKTTSTSAWFWPIKNVADFYDLHWKVIGDPKIFTMLFQEKIIQSKIESHGLALVGSSGKVSRSFISDNCQINGTVENSIIYPGVVVSEGAEIKNSIILPHVKIGPGTRIYRCIIDECLNGHENNGRYTIAGFCKIGTENGQIKNNDYPESLFNGITLIGKDCFIHNEARVGGGCYVASGLGETFFAEKKYLYDGTSLVR